MGLKIGLALGSGGLRGCAHLGVLKVLEREKIRVDFVAGCSIGSLVGALYCAGHEAETIIKLATHLKRRHWLDFVVPQMGLFAGERILETMRLLTKDASFSELAIPLSIVATDLHKGESVVFNQGSVSEAVRASTSVPGVFVPYEIDGRLFVDGAVLNPTPIDVAFDMGADAVIAIDLSYADTDFKLMSMFDVIVKSIDIMEQELIKHRKNRRNVVLLRPEIAHISPSSFEHMNECITLGETCAVQMLPKIYRLIGKKAD